MPQKRGRVFFAKGQRGTLKCVKAVANDNNDSSGGTGNNTLDRAQEGAKEGLELRFEILA